MKNARSIQYSQVFVIFVQLYVLNDVYCIEKSSCYEFYIL